MISIVEKTSVIYFSIILKKYTLKQELIMDIILSNQNIHLIRT